MVDFRFQRYWTKMGKNEQLRWLALSSCGNNMIIDVNDDDDGTKWSFCRSSGCDLDTTHTLCLEMQWNVANRSYHRVDMLLLATYMQSGPELSPCRVMSCHVVLATTEFFRFFLFCFGFVHGLRYAYEVKVNMTKQKNIPSKCHSSNWNIFIQWILR